MEKFPYGIQVAWSPEDEAYVARVPALPGCAAHGDTPASAIEEAQEAATAMLEVMAERGDPLPGAEPAQSHSGNIRLRLPRSLHARLDALASAEGVSLNALMVALLAEGAGYKRAMPSDVERTDPDGFRYSVAEPAGRGGYRAKGTGKAKR